METVNISSKNPVANCPVSFITTGDSVKRKMRIAFITSSSGNEKLNENNDTKNDNDDDDHVDDSLSTKSNWIS